MYNQLLSRAEVQFLKCLLPSLFIQNPSLSSEYQTVAEKSRDNGVLANWLSERKTEDLVISICHFWGLNISTAVYFKLPV